MSVLIAFTIAAIVGLTYSRAVRPTLQALGVL